MFVHKREGYVDHKHETAAQARLCEQDRTQAGTVKYRDEDGMLNHREARHQTPCVCSPYDRCAEVRQADAQFSGNWRDRFRSYND
jgi:hypothetical protein